MKLSSEGRGLRSALVVVLCALFFILAMGITLLGSGVYRDVVAVSDGNETKRTALSYLINQVRRSWSVGVGSFEYLPALELTDSGESDYHTVLYVYDGQLRELYAEKDSGMKAEDGVAILPLDRMELTLEGDLLTITVTAEDGEVCSASVTSRMGVNTVPGGEVLG